MEVLTTTGRSLVFTVFVFVGSTVGVAQPANATNPGSNGKIAYIRNDTPPTAIGQSCLGDALWIMNANGSSQTPLTSVGPDYAFGDPAFSPDGRYLAYVYTARSEVEDAGNTDVLQLGLFDMQTNQHLSSPGALTLPDFASEDAAAFCEQPYGPTWSPNGEKIAIQNYYGLAVFTLTNPNDPTYLPFPSGGKDDPSWAPFGGKFAVGSVPDDVGTITTGGLNFKKITWNGLTGDDHDGTDLEVEDHTFYPHPLSRPDWSPDGETLLVNASRDGSADRPRMGILDTCGGPLHLLDPNPIRRSGHGGYDGSWSPDGEKIVFSHLTYVGDAGEPEGREQNEIWVMNADGTGLTQLTNTPATETTAIHEASPDWQPVNPDPAPEPPECPNEPATIEGRVLDGRVAIDGHSNPLPGATVTLRQDGSDVVDPITADDNGSFFFENVPEGTYRLRATLAYREDNDEVFGVRHRHTADEPVWVETEIDVASGDSAQKDIVFSSASSAQLAAVSPTVALARRSRLDDLANIFWRTHQYAEWVVEELGVDLTSEAYPGPVEMFAFSAETDGAHYRSVSTEIHISEEDSLFSDRDQEFDEGPENAEWHEFTHHLGYANVGAWGCGTQKNHGGTSNDSTCDSFSEGAAAFFPAVADRTLRSDPEDSMYATFGSLESNGWRPWAIQEFEIGGVTKKNYQEDMAVSSLMWDLYDEGAEEINSSVFNDDRSGTHFVTYTDDIAIPVRTLYDVMRSLGDNPTIFRYWTALHGSPQVPSAYKTVSIDLDEDEVADVAPLDIPFLMHGFYPLVFDGAKYFFLYDPDIADDLSEPGTARNRVVGRTDRPLTPVSGPPQYFHREHMDEIPTANIRFDVTDQADAFVPGATAKLRIDYPEGLQTLNVKLADGKADLVHLELPPTEDTESSTEEPECVASAEETIKVMVTVSKDGEQSAEKKKFNSCSYGDALLEPKGNALFAYDFTVERDRSTTTSLNVQKSSSKVTASGTVKPAHAGKKVEVTLLRKQGGTFVVRGEKMGVLDGNSKYSVSFARLPQGSCRMDAKFPGDVDHDPSKKSVPFLC